MKNKKEKQNEDMFSKSQIIKSKSFIDNADLLKAVLKENKKYTLTEVKEIIKNYMKGKVE